MRWRRRASSRSAMICGIRRRSRAPRAIAGPAGNPPTVEVPIRVAVVQAGVQEKTIATKVYRTTVSMAEGSSVPFSLVAEDLVYPVPPGAAADSYVFYIGFDPQALKPEPKARATKKR